MRCSVIKGRLEQSTPSVNTLTVEAFAQQSTTYVRSFQHAKEQKQQIRNMANCHLNRLKQIPGNTLCVDLIGPYTIPRKGKNPLKLWCLTIIDPSTGWFEMAQIPNKTAAEIAYMAEKNWFTRYPLPQWIVFDRGTKFMAEFAKMCQNDYGLKRKPITTRNPVLPISKIGRASR